MAQSKIPVIAIVGPTASGKTELSVELAFKFSGEIISSDSMQIYKEFDICTAKPGKEQLTIVKHYFIDEMSVQERFSVADYVKRAHIYAKEISKNNKVPIVVGGTGLYVDSFLKNINFEKNEPNHATRENLYKDSLEDLNKLYRDLRCVDETTANQIHPNDRKRIIRALEFYYSHGYPISEQVRKSMLIDTPYNTVFIGLNFQNRNILYERINSRVDNMIKNGLVQEVEDIFELRPSDTASVAIGYKEMLPYIKGECSLDEAIENLKRGTRKYAKRQITWFKRNKDINWIYIDKYTSFEGVISEAEKIVKEKIFNDIS